jgi:hypothetical protein
MSTGQSRQLKWNYYIFNTYPTLTSPENGAVVSNQPTFTINRNGVSNATALLLAVLDENENIVYIVPVIEDGSTTYSVTVPQCRKLNSNNTYYWLAAFRDNLNWEMGETRSEIRSFTVKAPGPTPWLLPLLLDD